MQNNNLYIKELELQDFKCFDQLFLHLHPRLNVFFGKNGTGKSSILEAISIALGLIIDKLGKNSATKVVISEGDIKNGKNDASIGITMYDGDDICWVLKSSRNIEKGTLGSRTIYEAKQLSRYVSKLEKHLLSSQTQSVPIFVSYRAMRHTDSFITQDSSAFDFTPRSSFDDAISMNLRHDAFFAWFKNREDLENELKIQKSDMNIADPQLDAVRAAIQTFSGFNKISISRKDWKFSLQKNGELVYFDQLSDGEKGYMLLVGDIARRLAIANPAKVNPLEGKGVVLIDEIELHLHPKWQRAVVPQLLKTFPRCQFIVSSHSPQVLGEVESESIWILEEGTLPYHPERSYGMDSAELLDETMGAESRNADVSAKLSKIDRAMNDGNFDEVRALIQELAKKTKTIPALLEANATLTVLGEEEARLDTPRGL